jgi:hypothetical protein
MSSTRGLGPGSGTFRALHRPEARSFEVFWRLGLARAKGIVGSGAEPDGIGDRPGIRPVGNRSKARAGARLRYGARRVSRERETAPRPAQRDHPRAAHGCDTAASRLDGDRGYLPGRPKGRGAGRGLALRIAGSIGGRGHCGTRSRGDAGGAPAPAPCSSRQRSIADCGRRVGGVPSRNGRRCGRPLCWRRAGTSIGSWRPTSVSSASTGSSRGSSRRAAGSSARPRPVSMPRDPGCSRPVWASPMPRPIGWPGAPAGWPARPGILGSAIVSRRSRGRRSTDPRTYRPGRPWPRMWRVGSSRIPKDPRRPNLGRRPIRSPARLDI